VVSKAWKLVSCGGMGDWWQRRPAGPILHLFSHLGNETVPPLQQLAHSNQGKAVGSHYGGNEISSFAGHDEPGEELMGRHHDECNPEIEVSLLGPVLEVPVQRRGHNRASQVVVLLKHLFRGAPDVRIGPAHPPQILGDRLHLAPPDPFPDPRREVHAGNAAGWIVLPGETGKVAMTPARGIAQQIARSRIFQRENPAGDPKPFIPQKLTPSDAG
jgi:hypothetical protein